MSNPTKIILIFILFLVLRVYFIFTFPPFIDESNYVNWGERAIMYPELRFEPITLWYKQPLPFWLFGLGAQLLKNPVTGARVLNLLISLPTFFILYSFVKNLKDKKTAILALIFYTLCPIFIFFQSTALIDPILLYLNLIILGIIFQKPEKFRLFHWLLVGLFLGLAFWTKNTAFFMVIITLCTIYYLYKFLPFFITFSVFLLTILPLVTRSDFPKIIAYNQGFTLSISEIFNFPVSIWLKNCLYLLVTLLIYLTPGVFLSVFAIHRSSANKKIVILLVWFLASCIPLIISLRVAETRYFLFAMAVFLPLAAIGANNIKDTWRKRPYAFNLAILVPLFIGSILITFFTPAFFSLFPKDSFIAMERDYAFSWPSGFGLQESLNYLETIKAKNTHIILALLDDGGSNASSYISASYRNSPNDEIALVYPQGNKKDFMELQTLAESRPVYFISSNKRIPDGIIPFLKLIKVFEKPGNEDYIGLYKISRVEHQ